MATDDIIRGLQGATKDTPAVIRLEFWQSGTEGMPPPPSESMTLAAYPTAPPPPPVLTPYWVVGDYVNVRDAPGGHIVAQPVHGAELDVDLSTKKDIAPNTWAKIGSGPYAGNWVAINVLSATRP